MLRLYFNKRGDRPWSIDSGPGTEEFTFVEVFVLAGVALLVACKLQ
jgi:hypothetical protein